MENTREAAMANENSESNSKKCVDVIQTVLRSVTEARVRLQLIEDDMSDQCGIGDAYGDLVDALYEAADGLGALLGKLAVAEISGEYLDAMGLPELLKKKK